MRSASLPRSDQIQSVVRTLNDQFVHPNPYYYHRHLSLADAGNAASSIEIDYFDPQEVVERTCWHSCTWLRWCMTPFAKCS